MAPSGKSPSSPFDEDKAPANGTLPPASEAPPVSQADLRALLVLDSVNKAMIRVAYDLTHSLVDTKDLVSKAVVLLLSGVSPWRPDPGRPVMEQLGGFVVHTALIIRRCHWNQLSSAAARREQELPDELADRAGDEQPHAEQIMIEPELEQERAKHASEWIGALRKRMHEDADALDVIDQHVLGRHDAQEQADALGWKLERVMLARRRIAYHAPDVRAGQLEKERRAEEARIARAAAAAQRARAARKEKVKP